MTPEEIQELIDEHIIVVFGKGEKDAPRCGFTANVQGIFDDVYPEYTMVDILGDTDLQQTLCKFSDWPTFPQIYIKGEFIGGGDIITEMYEEGELKDMVKEEE